MTGAGRPLGLLLLLPLTIPLAWRRLYPTVALVVVTAALVVQVPWAAARMFDETFTGFVCVLLAAYAVGRHARGPAVVPVLIGCVLAVGFALGLHDRSTGSFVLGVVFVAAPAATGRVVATRAGLGELLDSQAEQLRENAETVQRTRVAQVRARIAVDVQDLVRRRVQDMVARCEAARRVAANDTSAATELLAGVEVDGRAALDEIRTMLGVLRGEEHSVPSPLTRRPVAPTPTPPRSLPVRRVELVLATAFVVVLLAETLARPGVVPIVSLTMLVPLLSFAVGVRASGPAASAGLTVALAAVAAVNLVGGGAGWGDYVFPWLLAALAWSGGRLVREQNDLVARSRRRAAALERSAHVRAAAAASQERLRLTRELHDVLAHTLVVMVVQAGAARRSLERGRAGAVQAMQAVEDTGRDADTELRRLFTAEDPGGHPFGTEVPGTPGLRDLRTLVERARAAGLSADLVIDGDPAPVPAGLALAVYRVAQEAVTNVMRHAQAQHVLVALHQEPAQLRLVVSNDGQAASETTGSTTGNGLTGMRERARVYGGEVTAGQWPEGGFLVEATFPLTPVLREQPA
ncbi:MAG: histidine kinase [Ornithinibacter sp.]